MMSEDVPAWRLAEEQQGDHDDDDSTPLHDLDFDWEGDDLDPEDEV